MARRLAAACAATMLAACGSSTAIITTPEGGATQPAACWPHSSHTIAWDGAARVFRWHAAVYGCSSNTGMRYRLGAASRSIREGRVYPVALAGELVGYGLISYGVDNGSASVVVRSLTSGKTLRLRPATQRGTGPESIQSIDSLVLRRHGAVAWIGVERSIIGRGTEVEVLRYDSRGEAALDSGPAIKADSLRLHGSRIRWMDGAAVRSATLR